jgi:hypothetical protein
MTKHVADETSHKSCITKYIYIYIYTGSYTDSYLISDFGLLSWRGPGGEDVLALLRCYTALIRSCIPTFRDTSPNFNNIAAPKRR